MTKWISTKNGLKYERKCISYCANVLESREMTLLSVHQSGLFARLSETKNEITCSIPKLVIPIPTRSNRLVELFGRSGDLQWNDEILMHSR